MLKIIACNLSDTQLINTIETLASEIWNEHYTPIIGKTQVEYMLNKFQSKKAMQKQIQKGFLYYLLQNNAQYIGYIGLSINKEEILLSKIYIKSEQRRQGFGAKVIQFIAKLAKENELSKITLTVNKHNTKSINAYKKFGFTIIDSMVMDIGNGFVMDDFKMEKNLLN